MVPVVSLIVIVVVILPVIVGLLGLFCLHSAGRFGGDRLGHYIFFRRKRAVLNKFRISVLAILTLKLLRHDQKLEFPFNQRIKLLFHLVSLPNSVKVMGIKVLYLSS